MAEEGISLERALRRPPMLAHRQHEFLCSNRLEGFRFPTTIRALVRKGLLAGDEDFRTFTKAGREYVRGHKEFEFQRFRNSYLHQDMLRLKNGRDIYGPEIPVIHDDEALQDYMMPDGERQLPPVTVDQSGDFPPRLYAGFTAGKAPLAYLHPFYLWEIEREKSAGQFLKRTDYLMHDMAYSYDLETDEVSPRMSP